MEATKLDIHSELEDLGFMGKQLKDLGAIIKSQDDLEELESFILDNEYLSNMSIVSEFREKTIKENMMDKPTFIMEYTYSADMRGKRQALEGLLKIDVDDIWIYELDDKVDKGNATLGNFYEAFLLEPTLHIRRLILESTLNF